MYQINEIALLYELAGLHPTTLATMHGASFNGDCVKALMELDGVMQEVWSQKTVTT